jgi:hypothetical protein
MRHRVLYMALASLLASATASAHEAARPVAVSLSLDAPARVEHGQPFELAVRAGWARTTPTARARLVAPGAVSQLVSPPRALGARAAGQQDTLTWRLRVDQVGPLRLRVVVDHEVRGEPERAIEEVHYLPDGDGALLRVDGARALAHVRAARLRARLPAAASATRDGQPDLTPQIPEGWEAALLLSGEPDTNTSSPILSGAWAHLDLGFANVGDVAAIAPFSVSVRVNGEEVDAHTYEDDLPAGAPRLEEDMKLVFYEPGDHLVEVLLDSDDDLDELDEDDNLLNLTVAVGQGPEPLPDLTPYEPKSWDDAIVTSMRPGTRADDALFAGEPAYIDYAYKNLGTVPAEPPFKNQLLLDGEVIKSLTSSSAAKPDKYRYYSDKEIVFPAAGSYTFELDVDVDGQLDELDEDNNHYTRTVEVLPSAANLSVGLPQGWGDRLVLSRYPGGHVDTTLVSGASAYADFAIRNTASLPAEPPWRTELRVQRQGQAEATVVASWEAQEALDPLAELVREDVLVPFDESGVYTVSLHLDADGQLVEIFEDDNLVTQTVVVGAPDDPPIARVTGMVRQVFDEEERPGARLRVQVVDAQDDQVVAMGQTADEDGGFELSGFAVQAGYLVVSAESEALSVHFGAGSCEDDDTMGDDGPAALVVALPPPDAGGDAALGELRVEEGDPLHLDEAFEAYRMVWRAYDWFVDQFGYARANHLALHLDPLNDGTAFYRPSVDQIRLCRDDVDRSLYHEFGHAVHYEAVGYEMPHHDDFSPHDYCTRSDPTFALIEGWAEFSEHAIRGHDRFEARAYAAYDPDDDCDSLLAAPPAPSERVGVVVEGAAAAIFWDLWDGGDEDDDDLQAPDALFHLLSVENLAAVADPLGWSYNDLVQRWFDLGDQTPTDFGQLPELRQIYLAQLIDLDGVELCPSATCAAPRALATDAPSSHVGNTGYCSAEVEPGCDPGVAPEEIYGFELTEPTQVRATVMGFDAALSLRADGCEGEELHCEAKTGADGLTRLEVVLDAGAYALIVDGAPMKGGPYALDVAFTPACEVLDCDDGDACTEGDHCAAGACVPGQLKDCAALDGACAVGACDPAIGACAAEPLPAGAPCGAPAACADGILTEAEVCDADGACGANATRSCAPYRACASSAACVTSCVADGDCVDEARCEQGACAPRPEAPADAGGGDEAVPLAEPRVEEIDGGGGGGCAWSGRRGRPAWMGLIMLAFGAILVRRRDSLPHQETEAAAALVLKDPAPRSA